MARLGATPRCSGCVGLGPHTEGCRVRLEKALGDERADLVEALVGPNTEPATESQESAPAAQQEPASSSSGLAAPMPTQNCQNEQMDSPMELGPQERRERKGARPSETPTSEISGRPVVEARPAPPPMVVPTAEGSGTVVLSAPASSSNDEMTIGGFVRDRWNRRCRNSRPRGGCVAVRGNRNVLHRNTDAGRRAGISCGCGLPGSQPRLKPLRLTTREQVKGSNQKKCERDEPRRSESLMNSKSKMEVDESEMRSTPGKKIWSNWVEIRKDPNSSAIRCRLCATEVNTCESRSDTFAATPPPLSEIRATELGCELQVEASKCVDDLCCV